MNSATDVLPGLMPHALQQTVQVIEQVQLARDTYRLRVAAPELAERIIPGQFVMVREPGLQDPLLGRPFALYDTWLADDGTPAGVDIVYLVLGKMTHRMSAWQPGDWVELWGPLGNGFPLPPAGRLVIVGGGIGQTPFLAVAREALGLRTYGTPPRQPQHRPEVIFCYGVRTAEYLAGLEDFAALGISPRISTDDGSQGHGGFVTALLAEELTRAGSPISVLCCGPEPLMHAVARMTAAAGVDCWLSLETPMACGFGACFSCVTKVRLPDGSWDYRRVCVEGPVFPASELAIDE